MSWLQVYLLVAALLAPIMSYGIWYDLRREHDPALMAPVAAGIGMFLSLTWPAGLVGVAIVAVGVIPATFAYLLVRD